MTQSNLPTRRSALATAATAAFTTNLFTGNVKGANDRVAVGFIGLGAMGSGNLGYAMRVPEIQPAALCDVYEPHLERAVAAAKKGGHTIQGKRDFRELIADKSLDAICVSTPPSRRGCAASWRRGSTARPSAGSSGAARCRPR